MPFLHEHILDPLILYHIKLNNYLTINKQHIRSFVRENLVNSEYVLF